MGWTIQHLDQTRSYGQIGNLMEQAASVLSSREMRPLAPLVTPHRDGYFALTPQQAADIRDALRTAADAAARSRRPWQWS
jgi:hypothetical protein